MLTPLYVTKTMLAGASADITHYVQHILVVSISASTITLSIDDEVPQRIVAREHIDCERRKYNRLRLTNAGGVAATVVLMLAETQITIESDTDLLTTLAGSLASIDQEISGSGAAIQLANLALPASPAAGLQVLAANAAAVEREVTCPQTNGGYVYLGITAARCSAADKFVVIYPGGIWWSDRYKGPIFASGSDAAEVVNARES